MDPTIGFIIQNVPYLWLDKNVSIWGIQEWNQQRFSRIYLVHPDQPLYQGYLLPSKKEPSEYFRGSICNICTSRFSTKTIVLTCFYIVCKTG